MPGNQNNRPLLLLVEIHRRGDLPDPVPRRSYALSGYLASESSVLTKAKRFSYAARLWADRRRGPKREPPRYGPAKATPAEKPGEATEANRQD